MIVILTGGKKNVGDFLIANRAKTLLRKYIDDEIVEIEGFQELDEYLYIINNSRMLLLCGGPAYGTNLYPGIYPLVSDVSKIEVPIIPFGLGWSGSPFHSSESFVFDDGSKSLLDNIHQKIKYSSCRDYMTKKILKNNGLDNVVMTGCPALYNLDYLNKKFNPPEEIREIVITTPANAYLMFQVFNLIRIARNYFRKAKIYLTFHRGILPDAHTSIRASVGYSIMALFGKINNLEIVDVSYDVQNLDFYKNCDLHVGYRVHGHLYFLSLRKPSILINEDGRGLGMNSTLNLPILNYDDSSFNEKFEFLLSNYQESNFQSYKKTFDYIDKLYFENMHPYLNWMSEIR